MRAAQSFAARSKAATPFEYRVLSSRAQLRTGCGLKLRSDGTFRQALSSDALPHWVVVPALGEYGSQLAAHLSRPDAVQAQRLLRSLHARKVRIGASCAAVFVLAEAGLLAGHEVTTTWWLAAQFRARFPDLRLDERRMVVRDGHLLTAGSAFSELDLDYYADLCARYLLIDRRPSQARYMVASHLRSHDAAVATAERWIDDHLAEPITVRALSKAVAMSEKTFSRKVQAAIGMSPVKLIQRRRLMMATHLIETSKASIEEVAARVGYRDSTTLRRLIRRDLGTSPTGLR